MALSKESQRTQEFLESYQYSMTSIGRYEWISGEAFLSTSGLDKTKEFIRSLKLSRGERVLDVGCGLGGHAFYMAENYDVEVLGVDISGNMCSKAFEYLKKKPWVENKVFFMLADITKEEFEQETFDVIYCRDVLAHILDKNNLFGSFYDWLKPGGQFLFTDYIRSNDFPTEEYQEYAAMKDYFLLSKSEYCEILRDSGFSDRKTEDLADYYLRNLYEEHLKLKAFRGDFSQKFSPRAHDDMIKEWAGKIERVRNGDESWMSGYGRKADTEESSDCSDDDWLC